MLKIGSAVILAVILTCLAIWVRDDVKDYQQFKLARGAERLAFYRRWVRLGFLNFTLLAVAVLAMLNRWRDIGILPLELQGLIARSPAVDRVMQGGDPHSDFVIGAAVAIVIGSVLGALIWSRTKTDPARLAGDVAALLPTTSAERFWAFLLCINAGVGEELMFRLVLPLLFVLAGLPAWVGVTTAVVIFGLTHWYQGWRGILATTLLGALMTGLYLSGGQLWIVMLVHALMDVNAMVVRPWLTSLFASRSAQGV